MAPAYIEPSLRWLGFMTTFAWVGCSVGEESRHSSGTPGPRLRSRSVDVDHGLRKGLRGFLRQIVPDAAGDGPVRIFARKFPGIGTGVQMRRTVGITFEGDGGHGDDRALGKPLVEIGILRLAFSQCEPPPIVMDHDGDVIGIVEGRCTAIERCIIEVPLRRSNLPNELREVVPVFVVASPPALGGKIKLVPPFELSLW